MDLQRLTNFLFEVGTLRKTLRSHRQPLLVEDMSDTISAHSFRVVHIGYLLAVSEKADMLKVLLMCLFHDVSETRSGDQNRIHKKYVKVYEEEIVHDQLDGLVENNEIYDIVKEYNERVSWESHIAKDADILEQFFLLKEHIQAGNQEAARRMTEDYNLKRDKLRTVSGKALFDKLCDSLPHDWRQQLRTDQRR